MALMAKRSRTAADVERIKAAGRNSIQNQPPEWLEIPSRKNQYQRNCDLALSLFCIGYLTMV
jgi:hypothetical protein